MSVEGSNSDSELRRSPQWLVTHATPSTEGWIYVKEPDVDGSIPTIEVEEESGGDGANGDKTVRNGALLANHLQWSLEERPDHTLRHPANDGHDSSPSAVEHHFDDSSSVVSDSSMPSSVQQFYDIARDLSVQGDRLAELRTDIEESVMQLSQTLPDQEKNTLKYSAVDSLLVAKHQQLTLDIAATEHDLFVHKMACRAEGLDPERYRYRRISTHTKPSFEVRGHSGRSDAVAAWLDRGTEP